MLVKRNYQSHNLECLGLQWAVTDMFHNDLYEANFTVHVITDDNPLTHVPNKAKDG